MSDLRNKRLVIFGCGYVGSAVAAAAVAAGARVEALTRNPEKAAALRVSGLEKVVVADLASPDWQAEIEPGPDFVVNCVSSGGGPEGYRHSYVGGMQAILAWAAQGKKPVGTLVYTSSTSVYPQGEGTRVTETASAEGATANGVVIRDSEKLLRQVSPDICGRCFILRLAGIYGPGRHHLLDQLRTGATQLNGMGDHRLNLAHRDDIVAAILACLSASTQVGSAIFNVSDGNPAPRADVVRWLAEQLNRSMPFFDGSATPRRNGAPMPDRTIDSEKIREVLGWRPQFADFKAGFREILKPAD